MSVEGISSRGQLYDIQQRQLEAVRQQQGLFSPMGGISFKKEDPSLRKEIKEFLKAQNKENATQRAEEVALEPFAKEVAAFNSLVNTAKGFEVDSPQKQRLVSFWEATTKEITDFAKKEAARKTLGQILFVLERAPEQVMTVFSNTNSYGNHVLKAFSTCLAKVKSDLDAQVKAESKFGMATSNQLYAGKYALEMAKCLLMKTGELNAGIFDDVKKTFVADSETGYIKELNRVFASLVAEPALLADIKAPESKESRAWTTISSMLRLAADQAVTDFDARLCVLSAYLSDSSAGVNNPATDSITRFMKKLRPDCYRADLSNLITKSCITRTVSGHAEPVAFHVCGSSLALDKEIALRTDGVFSKVNLYYNSYLWESQAVQLALQAMGVAEVQPRILEALKKLSNNQYKFTTTVDDVLQAIAGDDTLMLERGRIAFSSYYENGLDASWKLAILDMANLRPQAQRAARVLNIVQNTLVPPIAEGTLQDRKLLSQVFANFKTHLMETVEMNSSMQQMALSSLNKALAGAEAVDATKKQSLRDYIRGEEFQERIGKEPSVNPLMFLETYFGSRETVKIADAHALLKHVREYAKANQGKSVFIASSEHAFELDSTNEVFKAADLDAHIAEVATQSYNNWETIVLDQTRKTEILGWIQEHVYDVDVPKELNTFKQIRDFIFADIFNKLGDDAGAAMADIDNYLVDRFFSTAENRLMTIGNGVYELDGEQVEVGFYTDPVHERLCLGMYSEYTLVRLETAENAEWEIGTTAIKTAV